MANPQVENGHIKIANEVWDAFVATRIPGEARQVFDFIIRKTWGFNKKLDFISLGQISRATHISRSHIVRAIDILTEMNLIKRSVPENGNSSITKYGPNKDFETWKVLPKKGTCSPKREQGVPHNGYKSVPHNGTYKRHKDNITKDSIIVEKTPHEDLKNLWNTICGETFGRVTQLSDLRRKHLTARWNEHPDLSFWETVFRKLLTAEHCLGKSDGGWKASFDFLIKNNNGYTKLMEGTYDKAIRKGTPINDNAPSYYPYETLN